MSMISAYEAQLAPYAARTDNSRGRQTPEPGPQTRSEFQRDRDRIIHCTAFRRLEYKTQVFVNHGEPESAQALADGIRRDLDIAVVVPELGERVRV